MSGQQQLGFATLTLCLGIGAYGEPAEPATEQTRRSRTEITEAIAAKLPKFKAPAPVVSPDTASSARGGESVDDIFKLPKITVRPAPFAPESEFVMLNAKGRLELAIKTHPGIRLGNIFGLNEGVAQAMQQEERLAAKKADLTDRVQRSAFGDSEVDKKIRALMQALLRRSATEREFP